MRRWPTRWWCEESIPNGIVDFPDGSFAVLPDTKRMRDLGLAFTAGGATMVVLGVGLWVLILTGSKLPVILSIVLIAAGVMEIVFWARLFPRALKADATDVVFDAIFDPKRAPRGEVGFIFRGQTFTPASGRVSEGWVKSYVFTAPDGRNVMSIPSVWFTDESMGAFAQRLGVHINGDFSVQVKDRIDPPGA